MKESSKEKLQYIVEHVKDIPEEMFKNGVLPLVNQDDYLDYEWTAEFIGISKKGEVVYLFESGCSCDGPSWSEGEIPEEKKFAKDKTVKGLALELKEAYSYGDSLKDGGKLDTAIESVYDKLVGI